MLRGFQTTGHVQPTKRQLSPINADFLQVGVLGLTRNQEVWLQGKERGIDSWISKHLTYY